LRQEGAIHFFRFPLIPQVYIDTEMVMQLAERVSNDLLSSSSPFFFGTPRMIARFLLFWSDEAGFL